MAAAAGLDWDYFKDNIQKIITDIMLILGTALLALGAIFVFSGYKIALGIALMALGAASLAGAAALNWNAIVTAIQGSVGKIVAIVSIALLVLGIILCCTGVALPLGIALIAAGAAGLVTVVALNWNAILDKLKDVWNSIKNWWNTYVAKYFTWEYWKNLGLDMINGIMEGLKSIFTKIGDWASGVWDSITGFFTGKSVKADIRPQTGEIAFQAASIPRLAAGAVVPPNREFMAVLGDQHHGNNLEAPEDLIRQIVREEAGSLNTDLLQAILEAIRAGHIIKVNEDVLGRTTVKTINNFTRQSGKPVLLL